MQCKLFICIVNQPLADNGTITVHDNSYLITFMNVTKYRVLRMFHIYSMIQYTCTYMLYMYIHVYTCMTYVYNMCIHVHR